ncbi:NAD-dependent epimerase/dehydratase family protein [Phycicoccus sp. BSK3Z-2]|uniref:NAD-dependent epimerase/dehydratase family protein n=1 Tax=Phycicoccus avicenniae TaxID=2828860 RepID=A0A941I037_9MICO|nr:NAD-dependent epimerase/dehydratase family protein [Phycicoccus avicenniae]MBR7742896.1 NAD-dependent epimerase/dehydratase family protein [Phycicoccus avicenniae]
MTGPLAWVVGAGGLVGRRVVAELERCGWTVRGARVPWEDEAAALRALLEQADRFAVDRGGRRWALVWCAGAGVVATGQDALDAEERVLGGLLDHLDRLPGADEGTLFLCSSAGGLYAGADGAPFTEDTTPAPLVPYGRAKLRAEDRAALHARRTGTRVVLGRIANVYGPGQRLGKPQGLVSQLCLADARGTPLPVYVSLDTIRDYVYVDDLAAMVRACLDLAAHGPPGTVTVKVLASGVPATVGHLVGEARRVFHRPLRTITVPGGTGQVLDLRLRSVRWTEVDVLARTPLAAGLAATAEDVRRRVVAGTPLDAA